MGPCFDFPSISTTRPEVFKQDDPVTWMARPLFVRRAYDSQVVVLVDLNNYLPS